MLHRLVMIVLLMLSMSQVTLAGRPFIIDTDMGVDDVIALLYLLKRHDIEIKAITIAANGSAHCGPALQNLHGLLKLTDKTHIPSACGPNQSLAGQHRYPNAVLNESHTLAGTATLLPRVKLVSSGDAVTLMVKTLSASSQPVTLLALGPLTNIALAFKKDSRINNKIQTIYIMGGAVHVPGNIPEVDKTINNAVAEWNIYIDPLAADSVFKQGVPLVLVSLDVTNQLPIDLSFYEQMKQYHKTSEADYVLALLNNNMSILKAHEWYFWDPLAAVIATDESIATFDTLPLRTILAPEEQSGATRVHPKGSRIRVVKQVDAKQFKDKLLHYLNSV